jgi:hypothetical protein
MYRLEWDEDRVLDVDSDAELVNALEELEKTAATEPFVIEMVSPAGHRLAAGLGRADSVLSWTDST